MDIKLYEDIMTNLGKDKNHIWLDVAEKFIKNVYLEDFKIYGSDTKNLYEGLFPESMPLFESIENTLFSLDEELISKNDEGAGAAAKSISDYVRAKKHGSFSASDYVRLKKHGSFGEFAKKYSRGPSDDVEMGDKWVPSGLGKSIAEKLKDFFEKSGTFIKQGIAGIIANPWPLLAAGVGVGVIIAIIKKFKKLSDEKKNKALSKLDKNTKNKVQLMLGKDESELKDELKKKSDKKGKK
jgi:hypothetical protein